MDFLNSVKNSLSQQTLSNLSSFFGESNENVTSGLSHSLNAFMAGLLKFSNSEIETKKVISVLNDGGHTGDILNNLESFTANFEKTQLLVTIGSNISNHFLGARTPAIIDKVSEIANIKKTSASSLLSLSAPIVLGFLGKEVKEKNLDSAGLRNLFKEMNDSVINALPPAISNIFNFRKATQTEVKATSSLNSSSNNSASSNKMAVILPWVVLALFGMASLYYYKFIKNAPETNVVPEASVNIEQKAPPISPEELIPDTNVTIVEPHNRVEVPITLDNTPPIEPKANKEALTPKSQIKEKVIASIKPAPKPVIVSPKPVISTPKPIVASKASTSKVDAQAWSNTKSSTTETAFKSSIPSGWKGVGGNVFKRNSAEIINDNALNSLMNQLKSNSNKLIIAPLRGASGSLSEDRAYALRDKLLEKGVNEDQIEVESAVSGKDINQIVIKIIR